MRGGLRAGQSEEDRDEARHGGRVRATHDLGMAGPSPGVDRAETNA